MKKDNFEKDLPVGYRQIYYLNAKNAKVGLIFNLVAVAVMAAVMIVALLAKPFARQGVSVENTEELLTHYGAVGVFFAALLLYIVLHELVHGAVYKGMTGEKLTFGLSWSCAFCGVPNIYTYRKTALLALVAPLTVFTLIFVPLTVALYFVNPLWYLLSAFLFGMHLGGCSGDIYVTLLLLFKYRDKRMLMRDTGPEQYFYLPVEK